MLSHADAFFTYESERSGWSRCCLQAYKFSFDPRTARETIDSSAKPVAMGVVPVVARSSDGQTYPFEARIKECWDAEDEVFSTWPRMEPSSAYFVVFSSVSSAGRVSAGLEGTVVNTLPLER